MTRRRTIECTSEVGITVGLIDSVITVGRILSERINYSDLTCGEDGDQFQPIRDALTDLSTSPIRKQSHEAILQELWN